MSQEYDNNVHYWIRKFYILYCILFFSDLRDQFKATGLPTLIVATHDGQIITNNGRSEITEKGTKVFQQWLAVSISSSKSCNQLENIDR